MQVVYDSLILLLRLFITANSRFNLKSKQALIGRSESFKVLEQFRKTYSHPAIWFHAASLGEFEQGLPLMQAMKEASPQSPLVVTFFSPSGYEQRKNHPLPDLVCYLPFDTRRNAEKFVTLLNPRLAIFIKYEYWWHMLKALHDRRIAIYTISTLFTPQHIFFKFYGGLHRQMLHFFHHIFVQTEASKKLLNNIGVRHVTVSGDTRFDRVLQTTSQPKAIEKIEAFVGDDLVLIGGSIWKEDMRVIRAFINASAGEMKFIIAPHLVDYEHIHQITSSLKVPFTLFTEEQTTSDCSVMVLDTMGLLSQTYQYGHFAYIGGAFGDGLHNILEAATFGLPLVFGNKGLYKFPEAQHLAKQGGAFPIAHGDEATAQLTKLREQPEHRATAGQINRQYVRNQAGATQIILNHIKKHEGTGI